MKSFNVFYFAVVLLGVFGVYFLSVNKSESISFYGFAESNDTYINYNYPVVVKKLMVVNGQSVSKGDTLMTLARIKSKEILADQTYRIAELKAQELIWREKNNQNLKEAQLNTDNKLEDIELQILALKKQRAFKQSLAEDLNSVTISDDQYKPIDDKIYALESEKTNINSSLELRQKGINDQLRLGINPYRQQIKKLEAEIAFDESQKVQYISVTAPNNGIIGLVSCKEEEHIQSFQTLMSFYEPHTGTIKGYVHEDMKVNVSQGDKFTVTSLKDKTMTYSGSVVGLGSRIVEIPSRLRKIPELKIYGREVIIEITKENSFLQKEKVSISFVKTKG